MQGEQAKFPACDIEAELNYVSPGSEPFVYRASHGGEGQSRSEGALERHAVTIADARAGKAEFALDVTGFALVRHGTAVTDFYDTRQVEDIYEPEVVELVQAMTGAVRAVPFDHTLRTDSDRIRQERQVRDHVELVHNDYTERSARRRVKDLMPDGEAERLLSARLAIVNVWRSIGGTVETTPLALCDARSIASRDLIPVERQAKDRIGEMQQAIFSPDHRWYWFPHMNPSEALVFKTYDSTSDGGARLSLHSAFTNPAAPPDAQPRESIETRVFALF